MGKKSKTVDLVLGEDGAYASIKKDTNTKMAKSNKTLKPDIGEKPKCTRENHADEFLSGIDMGLDLIDKFIPRVERFLRLRG